MARTPFLEGINYNVSVFGKQKLSTFTTFARKSSSTMLDPPQKKQQRRKNTHTNQRENHEPAKYRWNH